MYFVYVLKSEIDNNLYVDYRSSNASIIKIYDGRITFYNPGTLYGNLTIEDLLSGNYVSQTRNKLIAKSFKEIGFIERYGSGILRVRQICSDYGVVEPKFEEVFDGFRVTLFKEKVSSGELNGELNLRQQLVYKKIKAQPGINANELSNELKIPFSTIDKYIRIFLKQNLIERKGSKKTGGYYAK